VALALFLGKPSGEEKSEHKTWPLSLRKPSISTWMRFAREGWACGKDAAANTSMVPKRENARRIFGIRGYLPDSAGKSPGFEPAGPRKCPRAITHDNHNERALTMDYTLLK
jgi:hypothetical protein